VLGDERQSQIDRHFMTMAIALAKRAHGKTHPNPMVGAVVVKHGKVIGQGYHRRAGGPHAEVVALRHAGDRARGSTLYVSLEPCAHIGRTGPCTQTILRAGVRRVVAAMYDPDPRNRGRGIRWLENHGITAEVGVLEDEARAMNRIFITRVTRYRPFVTVKIAQTLDGKVAPSSKDFPRWISGKEARLWVHRLRSQFDAILVGIGTVLRDDPRLTVRHLRRKEIRQPLRIVLDSHLRTPPHARILQSPGSVLIATLVSASRKREDRLRQAGAEIVRLPPGLGGVSLPILLKELARRQIGRLLIEGGAQVVASAFLERVVDRIAWVVAPTIWVDGRSVGPMTRMMGGDLQRLIRIEGMKVRRLGKDLLILGDVRYLLRRRVRGKRV
jgi:diaminohydroxyphosphoribosylaminopyrimidine deaminase/5-amino-6-(5-phosphoribosylamino)uracil reductase